jgi:hypothetical protein
MTRLTRSPIQPQLQLQLLLLLLFAAAAAGCTDSIPQLCPDGTKQDAYFALTLGLQAGHADQCVVTQLADGGAADGSLASSAKAFSAAICSSQDQDGGALVWLALASIARQSPLLADGGFLFGTDVELTGTSCGCTVTMSERITGVLLPAQEDGGVAYENGALTPLRGLTGTVVDSVDGGGPDAGCRCNVPCTLTYDLAGAKP